MHAGKSKFLPMLAGAAAALALATAPAYAGSDGCPDEMEGNCEAAPAPAFSPPAPVVPGPAPVLGESGGSAPVSAAHSPKKGVKGETAAKPATKPVATRPLVRGTTAAAPQGGVQAGAGGMAGGGSDAILLGLAGGGLFLMASGGALVARERRGVS